MSAEAIEIVERIQSRLVGRDVVAALDDAETQQVLRTIRDGLLRRVEFHLHREAAMRAAGLED